MCILVIRNFKCPGAPLPHQCKYMFRCSIPSVYRNVEKYEGAQDFPCMENLDTRMEWYDETCPACTGEISVPKTKPTGVMTTPHHDGRIPVRDYAFCLASWLLVGIHGKVTADPSYHIPDPVVSRTAADDAFLERQLMVLSELICQVRPEHGSLPQLRVEYSRPRRPGRMVVSVAASDNCDCWATQHPCLTNWATDIRRKTARAAYCNMMSNLDAYDLLLAFGHQEVIHKEHQAIQARVLNKNLSCQSRFPVPDMVQVNKEEIEFRTQALADDIASLDAKYLAEIPEEVSSSQEMVRHRARASLLRWARIILARDSGLTLKRARDILNFFATRVVKYNPDWATYTPAPHTSTWKRLAHLANTRPYDISRWVAYTAQAHGEGDHIESTREEFGFYWERGDRARAAAVHRNMATASEAELAELEHAECLVCLSEFKDHTTVLNTPVRNPRCGSEHSKHWVSLPCIIKAARTLHGADLTPRAPKCPACRTKFEPEDNSANAAGDSD